MRYKKLEDLIISEFSILNNININFTNIAIINSSLSSLLIKSTGFLEQKLHSIFCYRNETDKEFRDEVFKHAYSPNKYLARRLDSAIIHTLLPEKKNKKKGEKAENDKEHKFSKLNETLLDCELLGCITNIQLYYRQSIQQYEFYRMLLRKNAPLEDIIGLFNGCTSKDIFEFVDYLHKIKWLSDSQRDSKIYKSLDKIKNHKYREKALPKIQSNILTHILIEWKDQQKNKLNMEGIILAKKKDRSILNMSTILGVIRDMRNSLAHGQIENIQVIGMANNISYFWLFDRLIILDRYIQDKFDKLKNHHELC